MKIALVALPQAEDSFLTPPLPLAYFAALLEQQRHIVRIYDLALRGTTPLAEALTPLRAFRPHIVVVTSADPAATDIVVSSLCKCDATVLRLPFGLRKFSPGPAVAQAIWAMNEHAWTEDEQNVIFSALLALDDDLDSLPFPARHLLALEQYPLFTPIGELQTTVAVGQPLCADSLIPRNPALVVAELRSIAREHAIRHVVFAELPLTNDLAWLHDMLYHLATADLGIGWEGSLQYQHLTPELLRMFHRSGCETLCLEFDAVEVLGSKTDRAALSTIVGQAHELGMNVRAQIQLEPPYGAIPALVDVSATFGLDDVRFSVHRPAATQERAGSDRPSLEAVVEMARSRYRSSRSRQFFIERFGPQLGPMLWRAGRAGLLGRAWQRYADGGENSQEIVVGSYSD